jgi:hypothetical protein
MLTWSAGLTPAAAAFAAAVGDSVTLVVDHRAFQNLLSGVAPLAMQRMDSRAWVNQSPSPVVRR